MAKSSRLDLLKKDIEKAMDFVDKATKRLDKALARLPKSKPINIPPGTQLAQRYGNFNLQDVLRDLHMPNVTREYQLGVLQGTLDVMQDIQTLLEGEGGFEL